MNFRIAYKARLLIAMLLIISISSLIRAQPISYYGSTQVNKISDYSQTSSAIDGLTNGGFVVVWEDSGQDGSDKGVFARIYNRHRTPIGEEFQVNEVTDGDQSDPSVAGLTDGKFVIAYQMNIDNAWQSYYKVYKADGTVFLGETKVNEYEGADMSQVKVTALMGGGFVAVWHSDGQDGSYFGVYGKIYNNNGEIVKSEFQLSQTTQYSQLFPRVCGNSNNGGFIVSWRSKDSDDNFQLSVTRMFYKDGSPQTDEIINPNLRESNSEDVTPAMLSNGGFVVVWRGDNGAQPLVLLQLYSSNGSPLSANVQVTIPDGRHVLSPFVIALDAGEFVVTWALNDGIYGQRFYSSGLTKGAEFAVSEKQESWYEFENNGMYAFNSKSVMMLWNTYGADDYEVFATLFVNCDNGQFQFGSSCFSEVPAHTYSVNGNYRVSACDSTCGNCSVTSTNCTSCNQYASLYNHACNCNDDTYLDANGSCTLCSSFCSACTSSTDCFTCKGNAILQDYQCSLSCAANFYGDVETGTCKSCSTNQDHPLCKKVSSSSNKNTKRTAIIASVTIVGGLALIIGVFFGVKYLSKAIEVRKLARAAKSSKPRVYEESATKV